MPFVSRLDCREIGSDKNHVGTLRDISINGLFVEMLEFPVVGCQCLVTLYFEGDYSRLVVENVNGIVVRSEAEGVAVKFNNRLEWFVLIPLFFRKISGKTRKEDSC